MHECAIDVQNRMDIFTDAEASSLDSLTAISYVPHFQVASGRYHQLLLKRLVLYDSAMKSSYPCIQPV